MDDRAGRHSTIRHLGDTTALFHDMGKVGYPGKPHYLPNGNRWEDEKRNMTYRTNPEAMTMNLAVRSLYLIGNRIDLTEDEAQAIVSHGGVYPVSGGVNNLDYHHKECQLQMIVHFADKWTAAVDEEGAGRRCDGPARRSCVAPGIRHLHWRPGGRGQEERRLGLEFCSPERKLTEKDVDKARRAILAPLEERFGANLRA
ncbi:MAG: hypothetical protein ACYDGS_02175 [Thermoleophilia bacterium]